MKILRATLRLLALSVLMLTFYLLLIVGLALLWRSSAARLRWRNFIARSWGRSVGRLAGLTTRVEGTPPTPPFLLVSNHLGYIDIILFSSLLGCVFVAKKEIEDWPVVGRMCRAAQTIFVDRENRRDVVRVNRLIEQALTAGKGVVLFPEGTSTKGETVAPFNAALLAYAAQTGFPVAYAAVSYRTRADEAPAHLSVCWWGDMTFADHLFDLFKLSAIEATVRFGSQPVREENRKVLANELWQAVKTQFIPVVALEETCRTTTHS